MNLKFAVGMPTAAEAAAFSTDTRQQLGLTQEMLAERAGLPLATVQRLEQASDETPEMHAIMNIGALHDDNTLMYVTDALSQHLERQMHARNITADALATQANVSKDFVHTLLDIQIDDHISVRVKALNDVWDAVYARNTETI